MKTIFHANVDGFEVVTGFGEAFGLIDPVATSAKIAPLLMALDESKQMQALNAQVNARRQEAAQAFGQAEQARRSGDGVTLARQNAAFTAKQGEIAELEKQFPALTVAFQAAYARLWADNASYFSAPAGETLIDDAQAATLSAKHVGRTGTQQLTLAGDYVDDFRGQDFYLPGPPWQHMVIDTLGEQVPRDAIRTDALTDAQRAEIATQEEAARLAALTPEDRQAEADTQKAAALTAAAQKRSELEIAGDSKALSKSQAQYQDALAAITAKYGK